MSASTSISFGSHRYGLMFLPDHLTLQHLAHELLIFLLASPVVRDLSVASSLITVASLPVWLLSRWTGRAKPVSAEEHAAMCARNEYLEGALAAEQAAHGVARRECIQLRRACAVLTDRNVSLVAEREILASAGPLERHFVLRGLRRRMLASGP
jgi:hypothetical protein